MKNQTIYNKLNITKWHKMGYTGKDVHVAIIGYGPGSWHNGPSIVQDVAPDCKISELNVMEAGMSFEAAFQWCIDNKVDVVCCSLQKSSWNTKLQELSKKLYDMGCILIDSADNDSREIDRYPAADPSWFAIGAYDEKYNDRAGYSNYGDKMLCLSYTNLDSLNSKGRYVPLPHTSGATQIPSGIAAILKQYCDINPKEFENYVKEHAIDLGVKGKDKKTGYGVICMSSEIPKIGTVITMQIGNKNMEVDGVKHELDVAPFIKDSRTVVPVRAIAEAFNCEVEYEPTTQTITITKY